MLRALVWTCALAAIVAAALFAPIAGKSLWERSRAHGLPQAAERTAGRLAAWFRGAPPKARATTSSRPRQQRKAPAETITKDDRVALDELVSGVR